MTEMLFSFKKFQTTEIYSTQSCQVSHSKEHLHCTMSYWSVCRNVFASSEQIAGDLEAARGPCSDQSQWDDAASRSLATTAAWSGVQQHWRIHIHLEQLIFSTGRFFLYYKHAQTDNKSTASVCAQPSQNLCLSLKDVKLIITKDQRGGKK